MYINRCIYTYNKYINTNTQYKYTCMVAVFEPGVANSASSLCICIYIYMLIHKYTYICIYIHIYDISISISI